MIPPTWLANLQRLLLSYFALSAPLTPLASILGEEVATFLKMLPSLHYILPPRCTHKNCTPSLFTDIVIFYKCLMWTMLDDSDGDIFGSNRVDRVGGNRAITGQDLSRKRAPAPPDGTKDIFWTDWKISNVAITLLCSRGPLLKLHFTPKYWLRCNLKRSLLLCSAHTMGCLKSVCSQLMEFRSVYQTYHLNSTVVLRFSYLYWSGHHWLSSIYFEFNLGFHLYLYFSYQLYFCAGQKWKGLQSRALLRWSVLLSAAPPFLLR